MGAILQVLKIPALESEAGLVHGFSTMSLGTMGLTQAPDPDAVMASRRQFARALGIEAEPLTVAGAVHGAWRALTSTRTWSEEWTRWSLIAAG